MRIHRATRAAPVRGNESPVTHNRNHGDRIDYQIDQAARLLEMSIVGDISDDRALQEIPDIWRRYPEIAGYDSLVDLRADTGLISWRATRAIAGLWRSFAGDRDRGRRTALIVRNADWEVYARAIARLFPNRTFRTYRDVEPARAWLRDQEREPDAPPHAVRA